MSTKATLTMAEFLDLPDAPGTQELLHGELLSLPPAKWIHGEIAKRVFELLRSVLDSPRVWFETGYRLGDHMLQPDVSVSWPEQRIENGWFQAAPMIAVEVASRGNDPDELEAKVIAYLAAGAAEVWVIHPKTRSMTVSTQDRIFRVTRTYRSDLIAVGVDLQDLIPPER
jgi:Uma2 family endonuclease